MTASPPLRLAVLFETSGQVRRAFRALGWDATSFDLLPAQDGSADHVQIDVRALLAEWRAHPARRPDLVIAHPPCTYLCNSGVGRLHHTPPNPAPGVLYGPARWQAVHDAAALFAAVLAAPVPCVAVENPIMHKWGRRAIIDALVALAVPGLDADQRAAYDQTIQPYQFGDDASKRTALWLSGLPPLDARPRGQWYPPRLIAGRKRWGNQTDSGQNKLTPSADRGLRRADTYPGIAAAMAEQWTRFFQEARLR